MQDWADLTQLVSIYETLFISMDFNRIYDISHLIIILCSQFLNTDHCHH